MHETLKINHFSVYWHRWSGFWCYFLTCVVNTKHYPPLFTSTSVIISNHSFSPNRLSVNCPWCRMPNGLLTRKLRPIQLHLRLNLFPLRLKYLEKSAKVQLKASLEFINQYNLYYHDAATREHHWYNERFLIWSITLPSFTQSCINYFS